MIVPDGDERPTRARVLQVGIGEIALVDGAIAVDRQRVVEVAACAAIGNPADFVDRAVVARLHLIGILDHLVDEIAEVKNETELLGGRRALIFEDHPAIGVELAFVDVLAADEGEVHRPWIVRQRRGDRAADAAAVSVCVGEAVPVDARRLETADQHARRPVRSAETGADAWATTRRNASSSATSTVSTRRPPDANGRRVQRMTLRESGSPDATPSG